MTPERKEFLRDIATTAVEGGIGYWASCKKYRWSSVKPASLDHMLEFPEIEIVPAEDPEDFVPCKITRRVIQKGLAAITAPGANINVEDRKSILLANTENDASYIDADAADAIVQFGLFGELVFG